MSQPYVGEIRLFPYNFAPNGWFDCDGSLLSISEYEVLYTLLGTTYGGDGVNTFGLPNLCGRVPIHQGTGLGLGTYVLGQMAGTESVTLLSSQMPAHSHTYYAANSVGSSNTPSASLQLGAISGDTVYTTSTTDLNSAVMQSTAVGPMGGSQPHDNTMPSLVARFCIAWAGVFPSQG
ncbi:tail fiber protein [Dyella sp.]|jgi:microcystin-dependent protein|uniref:phage tail protein n=1 Tax=Dyella sp. TaxID=1869338 RepID=UPI0032169031